VRLDGHVFGGGAELRNIKLEMLTSDPAGLGVSDEGRPWYRSDLDQVKIWIGASAKTLRDTGTPITSADIQDGTITDVDVAAANKDGVAGTASMRTLGTGAQQAFPGTGRLDQLAVPTNPVPFNNQRITGIADATANNDAVSLQQLSAVAAGRDYKESVFAATTGSETYAITAGAVTDLTGLTAGASHGRIDGQEPVNGSRILIKNAPAASGAGSGSNSTQPANGIYVVTGGTTTSLTLTRATDADASAEVTTGMTTWVEQGTATPQTEWTLLTSGAITLGTTGILFGQTGTAVALSATLPLSITGNVISLATAAPLGLNGSNQLTITGLVPIAVGGTNAASASAARTNLGAVGKFATTVGDGSTTSFVVTAATHGAWCER
jgi:hypothetical protein